MSTALLNTDNRSQLRGRETSFREISVILESRGEDIGEQHQVKSKEQSKDDSNKKDGDSKFE